LFDYFSSVTVQVCIALNFPVKNSCYIELNSFILLMQSYAALLYVLKKIHLNLGSDFAAYP
jgi:hypothetical protein